MVAFPNNDNSSDVAAVKKTIEDLQKLDWYLCSDTHGANFVIDEKDQQKAYWVDQDILDFLVEKQTFTEEQRKAASKTYKGGNYAWNE